MKAGGMTQTDQFEVIDDHTFKVKMLKPSKLTLPDLAVPVPIVINRQRNSVEPMLRTSRLPDPEKLKNAMIRDSILLHTNGLKNSR